MTPPDVFAYLDYRNYLRDWFVAKKLAYPRYSHRAFARKAGQASPSLLLGVMEGRRNLTAATTDGFLRALGLADDEASFFRTLVELDQAESHEARRRAWERVRSTQRFIAARRIEGDAVEYLSNWYIPAIRELATCPGFRAEPEWLADQLQPRISSAQARAALQVLRSLGMLVERDGAWVAADVSVVTPHEVQTMAAVSYHLDMIDRAREALTTVPRASRHYCAVTVAIPPSLLPKLKAELDAMQERLLELCDASDERRTTAYQINLQLLPLSRPITEPA